MEDLGAHGRIILQMFFKSKMGKRGRDSSGSGWGQVVSSCEHGNGPSGSIICVEFLH